MTAVRPRTDGDPRPDTLGMRLAHRAMLTDVARLTALAEDLAAGTTTADRDRATAIGRDVADCCDSIDAHHRAEDDVLWPVLAASAGPHLDLAGLGHDHAALIPLLTRVRAAAGDLTARPDSEDAATALAVELGELRDVLDEHIADDEAVVLPAVEEHMSVADWNRVEERIRRRERRVLGR